jgi:hypothetical protein
MELVRRSAGGTRLRVEVDDRRRAPGIGERGVVVLRTHLTRKQERVALSLGSVANATALVAGGNTVPERDVALEERSARGCRGPEELLIGAASSKRHDGAYGRHAGERSHFEHL